MTYKKLIFTIFSLGTLLLLSFILALSIFQKSSDAASSSESAEALEADELEDSRTEPLLRDTANNAQQTEAGSVLQEDTIELDESYSGTIGFVFVDLQSGETVKINDTHTYTSASIYKLYVAYYILSEIDAGNLSLSTLMNDSTGETISDYLSAAITVSDNASAIAMAELAGWDVLDAFVQESGFEHTTFNPSVENGTVVRGTLQTTPSDVADFLQRLYDGTLLSETSSAYFLGLLNDQQLDYALERSLPEDIAFAHKTGLLSEVSHDAGIITAEDQDYITVIMTDGWSNAEQEATPVFEAFGDSIMDYIDAQ